jgi:hypothetical protein
LNQGVTGIRLISGGSLPIAANSGCRRE